MTSALAASAAINPALSAICTLRTLPREAALRRHPRLGDNVPNQDQRRQRARAPLHPQPRRAQQIVTLRTG